LQNLQDIRKATHDINLKFKIIQGEMRVTAALVNAIESKAPQIDQDWQSVFAEPKVRQCISEKC